MYFCIKFFKVTNEQYHADTSRISVSGLKLIGRSPAHYYAEYLDPNRPARKETDAMFDGTLLHTAVLEPDELLARYAITPSGAPDRSLLRYRSAKDPSAATKSAIAFWDEWDAMHPGKLRITSAEYDVVQHIADAVRRHPAASYLLDGPKEVERTIIWDEIVTGAPCKMRPDCLPRLVDCIVDLKFAEDASPEGFARMVMNYDYDWQAAFYLDGMDAIYESKEVFIFIAAEKVPPYAVGVYQTPPEVINKGREKYRQACARYVECLATGVWPAYSDYLLEIQMPPYYFKR